MIGLISTTIPPNMDMDKSLEFGQSPECEQSLAHSLLIELLAYVQTLENERPALIQTDL